MRRILFLDVNGVLNSRHDCEPDGLGESHLHQLKSIVDQTGCEIVLTSSWRLADDFAKKLRRAFKCHGIPIWIDSTPDLTGDLCEEVQAWLNVNGPCISVAIDDDGDGFEATEIRYVKTSIDHGLTMELAAEVISAFEQQ